MVLVIYMLIVFSTYWFISKSNFGKEFGKAFIEEGRLTEEWEIIKVACSFFWFISWFFLFPIVYAILKSKKSTISKCLDTEITGSHLEL